MTRIQLPRRAARVPRNSQDDLVWIAAFFTAAVIGGVISREFLRGHVAISWPATLVVALVVAAASAAALRTGALDQRPDGRQQAAGRLPAPAAGHPDVAAPEPRASRHQATGPQAAAPGGRNPSPAGWWEAQQAQRPEGPEAGSPTLAVTDPGLAGTVTMLDPAGKAMPPGSNPSAPASPAEAVIAQCPECGSFRMDGSVQSGRWQFACQGCRHEWNWQPGTPWPEVQVRPDHARRGFKTRLSSRRRTS